MGPSKSAASMAQKSNAWSLGVETLLPSYTIYLTTFTLAAGTIKRLSSYLISGQ
jgi:hypothetical protein